MGCLLSISSNAQEKKKESFQTYNNDKKTSHFIGFQTNELLRQLFSFGNTIETGNPFLLKYSLRFNEPNFEITAGLGYRTGSSNQNSGNLTTSQSDLFFRLGAAKKYNIGRRFEVGVGIDGVVSSITSNSENTVVNVNNNFFDSTYTSTKNNALTVGGGPQFTLAYYITPRIKLGTELTTYFTYSEAKFENISEQLRIQNGFVTRNSFEDTGTNFLTNFELTLPISLFLSVKF